MNIEVAESKGKLRLVLWTHLNVGRKVIIICCCLLVLETIS